MRYFVIILLFTVIQHSSGAPGIQVDSATLYSSFSYWNDNIVIESAGGKKVILGADDYVTAAFQFEIGTVSRIRQRSLIFNYDILTDRTAGFRTDLVRVLLQHCPISPNGEVKFGFGIAVCGDYGGDEIQNWYHRLKDFAEVDLDYGGYQQIGIILTSSWKPDIYNSHHIRIGGDVGGTLIAGINLAEARAGVQTGSSVPLFGSTWYFRWRASVGYVDYFLAEKPFAAMYGGGLTGGASISFGYKGLYAISISYSNNYYGVDQPRFGLTLHYGLID